MLRAPPPTLPSNQSVGDFERPLIETINILTSAVNKLANCARANYPNLCIVAELAIRIRQGER